MPESLFFTGGTSAVSNTLTVASTVQITGYTNTALTISNSMLYVTQNEEASGVLRMWHHAVDQMRAAREVWERRGRDEQDRERDRYLNDVFTNRPFATFGGYAVSNPVAEDATTPEAIRRWVEAYEAAERARASLLEGVDRRQAASLRKRGWVLVPGQCIYEARDSEDGGRDSEDVGLRGRIDYLIHLTPVASGRPIAFVHGRQVGPLCIHAQETGSENVGLAGYDVRPGYTPHDDTLHTVLLMIGAGDEDALWRVANLHAPAGAGGDYKRTGLRDVQTKITEFWLKSGWVEHHPRTEEYRRKLAEAA